MAARAPGMRLTKTMVSMAMRPGWTPMAGAGSASAALARSRTSGGAPPLRGVTPGSRVALVDLISPATGGGAAVAVPASPAITPRLGAGRSSLASTPTLPLPLPTPGSGSSLASGRAPPSSLKMFGSQRDAGYSELGAGSASVTGVSAAGRRLVTAEAELATLEAAAARGGAAAAVERAAGMGIKLAAPAAASSARPHSHAAVQWGFADVLLARYHLLRPVLMEAQGSMPAWDAAGAAAHKRLLEAYRQVKEQLGRMGRLPQSSSAGAAGLYAAVTGAAARSAEGHGEAGVV
jgi:hypothetical protein